MATTVAPTAAPQTKGGLFKRFTKKLRASSVPRASPASSTSPDPSANTGPSANTDASQQPAPPRKRRTLPSLLPAIPRAQSQPASAHPNGYVSAEQRVAALRARGLAPPLPMSEQEREMDLRFSVVVPEPGSGRSSAEGAGLDSESEAKRIKDEWMRRNSDDRRSSEEGEAGRRDMHGEERKTVGVVGVHEVKIQAGVVADTQRTAEVLGAAHDHDDRDQGERPIAEDTRAVSGLSPTSEEAKDNALLHTDTQSASGEGARYVAVDPKDVPLPQTPYTPSTRVLAEPEPLPQSQAQVQQENTTADVDADADEKVSQWLASSAPIPTELEGPEPEANGVVPFQLTTPTGDDAPAPNAQDETSLTALNSTAEGLAPIATDNILSSKSTRQEDEVADKSDSGLNDLHLPSSPPPPPEFGDPRSPRALSHLPTLSISPPPTVQLPVPLAVSHSGSSESSTGTEERGRSLASVSSSMPGMPALSPTRSASSCTTSSEPPHTPIVPSTAGREHGERSRKGSNTSDESDEAGKPKAAVGLGLKQESAKEDLVESPVDDEARFDLSTGGSAGTPLGAVLEEEDLEDPAVGDGNGQVERKKTGLFGRRGANSTRSPPTARPSRSIGNLRRSVTGSISSKLGLRPKSTLVVDTVVANSKPPSAAPGKAPNAAPSSPLRSKPSSPVTPAPVEEASPTSTTPARQALSPTMHSRGTILMQAKEIEDEESRRLAEAAFLDF